METVHARDAILELAKRPAVVTIDLHRGHLDPEVATLPLPADAAAALVERAVPMLHSFRELEVPVIHVITSYRDRGEILSNPYWRFQTGIPDSPRAAIAEHNLDHLPGLELMPGLWDERDAEGVAAVRAAVNPQATLDEGGDSVDARLDRGGGCFGESEHCASFRLCSNKLATLPHIARRFKGSGEYGGNSHVHQA